MQAHVIKDLCVVMHFIMHALWYVGGIVFHFEKQQIGYCEFVCFLLLLSSCNARIIIKCCIAYDACRFL